jgi:hypothetical protein
MLSPGREPRERGDKWEMSPQRGRQMDSPGRDLAAGSDPQATVEKEGWVVVSH